MKEDKTIINSQTSEETSTKTPVVEDVKEQGDPKFFRTVYKRKDLINEAYSSDSLPYSVKIASLVVLNASTCSRRV